MLPAIRSLIITGMLTMACLLTPTAHADTVTIVADEWCPFTCAPEADRPGFLIEITQAAFAMHGHAVEYKIIPWTRAVAETRSGIYAAVAGALRNDAPDFIFPEMANGKSVHGFFVKDPTWHYTGEASLKGLLFGTANAYSYGKNIDKLIANGIISTAPISSASPLTQNVGKLLVNRIDGVIAEQSVMQYTLRTMDLRDGIRFAGSPDQGEPVFIAFSPVQAKSREYARILAEGTRQLRESGELARILARYGLEDWR